ncbi:hypothetical protein [Geobacter sp. SVR]|uniref:hypothetical protein n=1 Tax=Geobacter sp. SVR TaxID=2495594 RepID=UPI00143F002F|nr:hypothetical protein [Geobacter sp. SVR]BCS52816.1 hypothetical protein GSVR_11240 [Geobacter sp. SVR]GCF86682.1 hypothetical protein GSbR_32820 [Geobacter sp. SVR]
MTLTDEDLIAIRHIIRDELTTALGAVIRANAELLSSLPIEERKRRLVEWGTCSRPQPDIDHIVTAVGGVRS